MLGGGNVDERCQQCMTQEEAYSPVVPPGLPRGLSWNAGDVGEQDADQQESIMTPTRRTHTLSSAASRGCLAPASMHGHMANSQHNNSQHNKEPTQ